MKTIIKTSYSLKAEGYSEKDRQVEEKEIRNVSGDNTATLKVINDSTLEYEYTSDKNLDWFFRNFEDCTFEHVK